MFKLLGAILTGSLLLAAVGCGGSSSAAPTPTPSQIFANNQSLAQTPPISLGTSGGNSQDVGPKSCCIGTLGSLWTLTSGGTSKTVILSNNHVLDRSGNGVPGEEIDQPVQQACTSPNTPPTPVAHLTQGSAIKPVANEPTGPCATDAQRAALCGHAPSNVDAAIAEIVAGQVDAGGSILDLGPINSTNTGITAAPPSSTIGTPAIGESVGKSGRTTGLTCSNIQSLNMDILIDYDASCGATTAAFTSYYTNQIIISGGSFSSGGDSGSLIVDTNTARPVGLLYGGSPTDTVANPIGDVITAMIQATGGTGFTIVGGGDHAISCARTTTVNSTQVGLAQAALAPAEQQRVAAVQQRRSAQILHDASIKSVSVGASADNPREGALLIHVSGTAIPQVAPVIDGVRTRLVFDSQSARISLGQEAIARANTVKEANVDSWMGQPGIQGMGISQSVDNPAETAIAIYVIKGMAHPVIPAVIDGVRTRVFESERFKAF